MAKRKSTKKVTYNEFLAWLEGVESMQEATWTPNAAQWKTIREKLNTVKPDVEIREVEVESETPAAPVAQWGEPLPQPQSAFEPPRMPPPRIELSAHRQQRAAPVAEGVPAATNGPFVDADGNLPKESEFL